MTADPDAIPPEIEVKLAAADLDVLAALARLRTLGPYRLQPRPTLALESIYLDTRDHALTRAGVALRLRHNGSAWEATAKWSGSVHGALHERPELTVALAAQPKLPFALPDGPLRLHLAALVLGRRLTAILRTDIQRRRLDLQPAGATRVLAEMALDAVQVRNAAGEPVGPPFCEVEIERRDGATEDLTACHHLLQDQFGLVPSPASKFERGFTALYGDIPIQAPLQADDRVAIAARKLVAALLARLRASDPGTRRGRDPESLHQMRVTVRRLRATLRTYGAALPAGRRAVLNDELRWLGQELGRVRDLDVQLANLLWHRQRLAPAARRRLDGFRRRMAIECAARRVALGALLDGRRYRTLLLQLERFALGPLPARVRGDAAEPVARVGRRAVKRVLRKILARGQAIGELPEAKDLHALRLRSKRLRYLLEALSPITGGPGRRVTGQLAKLQEVLGRFNDAMVAVAALRAEHAAPDGGAPLAALADDELRRAGAAQADFHRAWRRFSAKRTRRQCRALLKTLQVAAPA
ncbi:MAG: CHAD domain-containing protein [Candidatus Binatia bacterium]